MKTLLSLGMVVLLAGCLVETVTTTAIEAQNAATNAENATNTKTYAVGILDKTKLQTAIQAYLGDQGVYPASLDDLVPNYIAALPTSPNGSSFGYDPETGRLLN